MATLPADSKRQLYPPALCYHGCVGRRSNVLTFREHVDDMKANVRALKNQGYEFVLPSQYAQWQLDASYRALHPRVAVIHMDDCLRSIDLIVPWFIENGIPCGVPIITRRQGKYDAEDGFARWDQLLPWVQSGLVELMSHTHNMHHLTLRQVSPGVVDVGPVLEGPCWIDDGDVVYRKADDPRWYWDFSHVDTITLGVPLFGTDPYDGLTKIETTLTITPKETGSVQLLRLWMALSKPSGAGYPAQVEVRADGALVWSGTIAPKQYETRAQWVEREFYTIELDTPFNITAGTPLQLSFKTLNTGAGCALLYALVTDDDVAFRAVTNCQGLYQAGSQGAPNKYWQYIDYPAGDRWPVIPCLILGFGTGREATIAEYQAYVDADCYELTQAIRSWLTASWSTKVIYTAPDGWHEAGNVAFPDYQVIGWDAPNIVGATLLLNTDLTIGVQWLRIYLGNVEAFEGGDADPFMGGYGGETPEQRALIAEAQTRSYVAVFRLEISQDNGASWFDIGLAPVWRVAKELAIDVTSFQLTAGAIAHLRITPLNGGPTTAIPDRKTRWPIKRIEAGYAASFPPFPDPTQIAYPFGSYLSPSGDATIERPGFKDISPALRSVLNARGITRGYTIQAIRNTPDDELREPAMRQSEMALGRWLIYGDQAPRVKLQNLAAYAGYLYHDVQHAGVKLTGVVRADPLGNSTIRRRAHVLDAVVFDGYSFNGKAAINEEWFNERPINDGRVVGSVTYANDKAWLRARGVPCLIQIDVRDPVTGEVSVDIGYDVIEHPNEWGAMLVDLCTEQGFDGVCIKFEALSELLRTQTTAWFAAVARHLHDANLLFHAVLPHRTNTAAYDAPFKTEWCDHGEVIKSLDRAHVSSYNASGDFSIPGPHTPDDYWQLTLDHLRAAIPAPYWPRVSLGINLHGHIWDGASVSRVDYHTNIQQCLNYGKELEQRGGDAGWGTSSIKGWLGTPAGVTRANRDAAKNGFGGVYLDALDEGDISEFIPDTRLIVPEENVAFIDIRFPEEISFGSTGGPKFKTHVNDTESGDEYRQELWSQPLYEFDASLRVKNEEEYEEILNLFMVAGGKANTFRYKDWADYRANRAVIGMGNGVIANFQLVKGYTAGGLTRVRKITKPVVGTVRVWVGDTEVLSGWTVNHNTGLVTFAVPPVGEVSATFEFDVHVRFDIDSLPSEIESWGEGPYFTPGTIKLVEVRR